MNTYTKLQSGNWGVRVDGTITAGAVVTVSKRDGSSKSERIERVLWTGADKRTGKTVSLCAIATSGSGGGSSSRSSGRRTGCSCGSREDSSGQLIPSKYNCKQCCFDEYDC